MFTLFEFYLGVNGDIIANNHLSVSDATLKDNIIQLSNDRSLELLTQIECYKYNLLNSDKETYGVMAQQLEKIGLKNIVNQGTEQGEGHFKSVAYIQLLPLIIASLKKLNEKVNAGGSDKRPSSPTFRPYQSQLSQMSSFKPFENSVMADPKQVLKKYERDVRSQKRKSNRKR